MSAAFKCERCRNYSEGKASRLTLTTLQAPVTLAVSRATSTHVLSSLDIELCESCYRATRNWLDTAPGEPR